VKKKIQRRTIGAKEVLRRIGQRLPWYSPADTEEGRNVRNLYAETTWFGVLNGVALTFVSVFALRLGATTGQVGWLTALPALVNIIWLMPVARIIERQRRRMPLIVLAGFVQRMGYLVLAAMPFVMLTFRVEALILIHTLIAIPTAVINTAITALIPDLTGPERRGQVVSVRWLILSAVATAAVLLAGKFLDLIEVPLNYQILFGGTAGLSLLSLRYLRRIRVPDAVPVSPAPETDGQPSWERVRQSVSAVLSRQDFLRFAVASFVFNWGLYLPAALWSVLRVRDLGASDTWIAFIAVVIDGSTIAGYFYWGKVIEKRGNRWVLIVTSMGVTAYSVLTGLVPSIAWMIPTSILGGLTWSGCNLALFNGMLSVCPDERRPSYIAIYTILVNVTAFAAPLLGAALAGWIGTRMVFGVSGGVRLIGALLFLVLMR
jgi:MFS family permease